METEIYDIQLNIKMEKNMVIKQDILKMEAFNIKFNLKMEYKKAKKYFYLKMV